METTTSTTEKPHTLWASLVEAVRGSHQDYTTGSLNRAILLLAVPMVLEMVLESLFAVVDVFWVGRLGANAVATVGLTESMLSLVFAVAMGLSLSTTAMVARRIGEKDPEGAAVAGVQAIALGLIDFRGDRHSVLIVRAESSALDGRVAGDRRNRQRLHQNMPRRKLRRAACSFSTMQSFAARATPQSPCGCSGFRTSSISFSIPA